MPNLYDIIRFITVFQFFFFAIFLLTSKRGNPISNKLFGVFLLSKSFCFSNSLFFTYKQTVMEWSPHLFMIGESFEFLLGPALFFYTRSITESDFVLKKKYLVHLIPFVISAIFLSFEFHFLPVNRKVELLNGYIFTLAGYVVNYSAIYIHFIAYTSATLILLVRYHRKIKEFYSSIEKINLSWLAAVMIGFLILWGTSFIQFVLIFLGSYFEYNQAISVLLLFIFSNVILYKALKYPEIFSDIKLKPDNGKSILKEEAIEEYSQKLATVMSNEKPYLESSISLYDLAQKLSIPPRYLSYVINKSYNQNFYDYINKYRIEESKRLLAHPEHNSKTVLEILYDVGFNSKSVFNSAFKRYVGMTPSQYKRQSIN